MSRVAAVDLDDSRGGGGGDAHSLRRPVARGRPHRRRRRQELLSYTRQTVRRGRKQILDGTQNQQTNELLL